MTLIALLHKDSFPIAITDNLISKSISKTDNDYETPDTPLDTKEILDAEKKEDNFHILGMANKIWKYSSTSKGNPNCFTFFFMYAGIVTEAKRLFSDLINLVNSGAFSEDDVRYYMEYYEGVSAVVIYIQEDNIKSIASKDIEKAFIGYKDEQGNNRLVDLKRISQIGGSGFQTFSNLIFYFYKNHLSTQQKVYFTITKKDNFDIMHPNTNKGANIYNHDFFEQSYLLSLSLLAVCTGEALRKQNRSELVKNACGGLFNLRHFVELYPQNIQEKLKLTDTGLCQVFTERTDKGYFIKKFILTNYTNDNKTISFVLNKDVDITNLNWDIYNLIYCGQLFSVSKGDFDVFEIHDERPKENNEYDQKRQILESDSLLMTANQLIVYEYVNGDYQKVKFMPFAHKQGLHSMDKLVKILLDTTNNSVEVFLDLSK